ncbi:WAP four-disulfide core domain protein 18-like [Mesocricetus auratus]|uniref:WAP four-disulfide core domain protein 18-like n=1 Tax=Mesocricetus auratus TaxID=10036 RepID=A0ABM2XVZ7_MESAU|nr:WAP four-disulfide core domain protein 18-like [Mesocricetus auratus]
MKTATVLVLVTLIAIGKDSVSALRFSPGRLQKPGACPEIPTKCTVPILIQCSGDESCSNEQKCCILGCFCKCVIPVFETTDSPLVYGFHNYQDD